MEKKCSRCKETKPIEEFSKNRNNKSGYESECKSCRKERHKNTYVTARVNKKLTEEEKANYYKNYVRKDYVKEKQRNSIRFRKYGVTTEQYTQMLINQSNKCGICLNTFSNSKDTHIDHDHETGIVRGLLCRSCNTGFGMFRENITVLNNAIKYAEVHKKG